MTSLDADGELDTGQGPRPSRGAIIGMTAATVVMILVAVWLGWGQANQPLRWRDVGFEATSPTEATATFDIFFYTDADASCRVRALNQQFGEVGVDVVVVPRAGGAEQRVVATLATVEQAVTAVVDYCEPAN